VAHKLESDVEHYKSRTNQDRRLAFETYGTSGLGLDLTAEALPSLTQVFTLGAQQALVSCPGRPACPLLPAVDRLPKDAPSYAPVDLLVLGDLNLGSLQGWLVRVSHADRKPKLILKFWNPYWVLKKAGPMAKRTVTKWSQEGYQTTCRTLNGLQVGGVVDRSWLIVARIPDKALYGWAWPVFPDWVTRPMSNCLRPRGVPWSAYHSSPNQQDAARIPHADEDSMRARPGSFIQTDRGTRRLLHDELAKGLGAPKNWIGDRYPDGRTLQPTVALHILENLSPLLQKEVLQPRSNPQDLDDLSYLFSYTHLSLADVHKLDLWTWLLQHNHGRRARATKSGTLVPSFGNGSSTGTGGTIQYQKIEPFNMWMGVWSPRVYGFTSNWKEMRTLFATLERAKTQRRHDIAGTTFFYFTGNTTTSFAVTSGSST
jgi:hypothetical protein